MATSNRLLKGFFVVVVAAILLFAGYVWIALHWAYSNGERAGNLQKISEKGWICKTWEGELLLTTVPGLVPEKFIFTVRDEPVVEQLLANSGKRVVLTYSQHKGIPTTCFGDTEYFIDKVQVIQ
jgi:hypothetical protein